MQFLIGWDGAVFTHARAHAIKSLTIVNSLSLIYLVWLGVLSVYANVISGDERPAFLPVLLCNDAAAVTLKMFLESAKLGQKSFRGVLILWGSGVLASLGPYVEPKGETVTFVSLSPRFNLLLQLGPLPTDVKASKQFRRFIDRSADMQGFARAEAGGAGALRSDLESLDDMREESPTYNLLGNLPASAPQGQILGAGYVRAPNNVRYSSPTPTTASDPPSRMPERRLPDSYINDPIKVEMQQLTMNPYPNPNL